MINFLFIPIRLFHRKKSIFSTIHGSIRIGSLFFVRPTSIWIQSFHLCNRYLRDNKACNTDFFNIFSIHVLVARCIQPFMVDFSRFFQKRLKLIVFQTNIFRSTLAHNFLLTCECTKYKLFEKRKKPCFSSITMFMASMYFVLDPLTMATVNVANIALLSYYEKRRKRAQLFLLTLSVCFFPGAKAFCIFFCAPAWLFCDSQNYDLRYCVQCDVIQCKNW